MSSIHQVRLKGCAPDPMAYYLKALGVLRLVSESMDPDAKGCWEDEAFILTSSLDADGLLDFFQTRYKPTPIVAPWNGGSGFYPNDNKKAIDDIALSQSPRFRSYREVVETARELCSKLSLKEKPSKVQKDLLQNCCRNEFPDEALSWIDAAFVLTGDGAKYPPLLGTGGNDGRLEFTNNFMQRLLSVMDREGASTPKSLLWLRSSLFGEPVCDLTKDPIGQFFPSAAGGSNAIAGFAADSLTNPWDYIFMIEGALLFASASVKRLGSQGRGALAYPFTVRQAGVGYGSSSLADEKIARAEMWMPLWDSLCTMKELRVIFSEGRATVAGGRGAANGIDFVRAVSSLGVDRGISAFIRYGFQERNGMSYFAVPLSRIEVTHRPEVDLLSQIDWWMQIFRSRTSDKDKTPGSILRASRNLDRAIWTLCEKGGKSKLQGVLISLGQCERAISSSLKWLEKSGLQSIPLLTKEWLYETYDFSPEFRLAASLASVVGSRQQKEASEDQDARRKLLPPLRSHLEPVEIRVPAKGAGGGVTWAKKSDGGGIAVSNDLVWRDGDLIGTLNSIMSRRLILCEKGGFGTWMDEGIAPSSLHDAAAFLEGRVSMDRLSDLLWGLVLIDWKKLRAPHLWPDAPEEGDWPGAAYGILKLCFAGRPIRWGSQDVKIPLVPAIHSRAASGDGVGAVALAARRLRASGLPPAVSTIAAKGKLLKHLSSALLFPLSPYATRELTRKVIRKPGNPD